MFAIRGVYDGKHVKVLPSEPLPPVNHEVSVAIVFWEEMNTKQEARSHLREIARRMRAAREAMPPLEMSVKDLVEAGRER